MPLEETIQEAIISELERQRDSGADLRIESSDPTAVVINGKIDLEAVAMAIAGALAGGP